ncbi:Rib/alpha-like domain-containing protein, partial [Ligilactobacillus equi]|uniref:Rib/alpha-like domain-containing protein n=2 Tax=Ligilactobacillus equi TaxID=137357 RepID=UPI0012E334DC
KDDVTTGLGQTPTAESVISNASDLPADTTYAWTSTPDVSKAGVTSGVVVVTYPDGTTQTVDIPNIVVTPTTSTSYEGITISAGETASITPQIIGDQEEIVGYVLAEGAPEWATINETGEIKFSPNVDVKGQEYHISVEVAHANNATKEIVPITITISNDAKNYPVSYDNVNVKVNETVTATAKVSDANVVDSYELVDNSDDWITINQTTGELSIKPTNKNEVGDKVVKVKVVYKDKTTAEVPVAVTILSNEPINDNANTGSSNDTTIEPSVDNTNTGSDNGATEEPNGDNTNPGSDNGATEEPSVDNTNTGSDNGATEEPSGDNTNTGSDNGATEEPSGDNTNPGSDNGATEEPSGDNTNPGSGNGATEEPSVDNRNTGSDNGATEEPSGDNTN